MKNKTHNALLEREHDSFCRMTESATHWLHDKNRIVLEVNGVHLRDHILTKNLFLNYNDIIKTKQASMSLPEFEHKNAKKILYQKQYQDEEEGKAQFKSVAILDGITGEDGIFINWSDILDSAWDFPELSEASLVSERLWLVIGMIYLCCTTNSGGVWLIFSKQPSQMRWITNILTILCHRKRCMVT